MAEGKSNAEIGRELFVSEDTVKTHARRLFRKLGARDRAHAVAAAFRPVWSRTARRSPPSRTTRQQGARRSSRRLLLPRPSARVSCTPSAYPRA